MIPSRSLFMDLQETETSYRVQEMGGTNVADLMVKH